MGLARRLPCVGQSPADEQPSQALEVSQVTRHELEAVVECRGSDLEVGVGQGPATRLEIGADATVRSRDAHVEGQDGHRRKDLFRVPGKGGWVFRVRVLEYSVHYRG